jgi:acetyl-CoA carboxylase / biotin carboxylase 1
VEILIRLLETDDYVNNTVKTSWLDGLIAERFQTEKPEIMLSVVCGAIHVANETFRSNFQNFQTSLERSVEKISTVSQPE